METVELANGLEVALVPCEAESVAFGLFVASGSRHERAEEAGISHFIEHMLFKGTASRTPLDISRAIEGRGGMFNAWTSEEATAFYAHLPYEYLDEAVDILADMFLHASMRRDEFDREKQVVLEEIRMYSDEPDSVVMENLQKAVFAGSTLGEPIAGSAETLMKMRPSDLKSHMRSHYLPERTVAVVAGRFDRDSALEAVSSRLGRFGVKGAAKAKPRRAGAFRAVVPSVVQVKDVQQTRVAIGYRAFGLRDPRKYAAVVFDAILGRGMSSRLFQEVREKRGLSYDISSRMQFFSDAGMWTVSAGVDPAKEKAAVDTIDREIRRICTRKVGREELARTKEFLVGNFRLAHERVVAKLHFYGQTLLAYGRPVSPEEQVRGILAVTAADVLEVANDILDPSMRSVSRVIGGGQGNGRHLPGLI